MLRVSRKLLTSLFSLMRWEPRSRSWYRTITVTGVEELHGTIIMWYRIVSKLEPCGCSYDSGVLGSWCSLGTQSPLISKLLEMGWRQRSRRYPYSFSTWKSWQGCSCKNFTTPRIPNRYAGTITALMTVAKESTMVETVFENRFQHLERNAPYGLCIQRLSVTRLVLLGTGFEGRSFINGPSR